MADIRNLVQLLADGRFHSGEEIGRQLGVSRSAVWKQLKKLSEYGLTVKSVKGRGYRLPHKLELLDRKTLLASLSTEQAAKVSNLDLLFTVDSTNDWAMKKLHLGEASTGYVCLAEFQRCGRGRRGRQWISPLASNIIFSMIWEFEGGATVLEGLSLAVGVAVVRALNAMGVDQVQLKWPNDILLNDAKVGGVLLDMTGDPAGTCQVIVGVGINVYMSDQQPAIHQSWTSILHHFPNVSRNQLTAKLISELTALVSDYSEAGFVSVKQEWLSYDAYQGREVQLTAGDTLLQGLVTGVADNGALLLKVDGIERAIHGGEVSLRPAHDS